MGDVTVDMFVEWFKGNTEGVAGAVPEFCFCSFDDGELRWLLKSGESMWGKKLNLSKDWLWWCCWWWLVAFGEWYDELDDVDDELLENDEDKYELERVPPPTLHVFVIGKQ